MKPGANERVFRMAFASVYPHDVAKGPKLNPNACLITGEISRGAAATAWRTSRNPSSKMRYLDKLVDELAKGKAMEKSQRK